LHHIDDAGGGQAAKDMGQFQPQGDADAMGRGGVKGGRDGVLLGVDPPDRTGWFAEAGGIDDNDRRPAIQGVDQGGGFTGQFDRFAPTFGRFAQQADDQRAEPVIGATMIGDAARDEKQPVADDQGILRAGKVMALRPIETPWLPHSAPARRVSTATNFCRERGDEFILESSQTQCCHPVVPTKPVRRGPNWDMGKAIKNTRFAR
jgi:hypothetical protein